MKYLSLVPCFLIGLNSFAAQLTVINRTGIPTLLKINKNKQLVDVTQEKSEFEFSELASLRFYSECDNKKTDAKSFTVQRNKESVVAQNVSGTYNDSYDLDKKIVFAQLTKRSQKKLMNRMGLDGDAYFKDLAILCNQTRDIPADNLSAELLPTLVKVKDQLESFSNKLETVIPATGENPSPADSEKDKATPAKEVSSGADHVLVTNVKRKQVLKSLCKANGFSTWLLSKEKSDVTVEMTLDQDRNILINISSASDGLFHFNSSAQSSFHKADSNLDTSTVTITKKDENDNLDEIEVTLRDDGCICVKRDAK